MEPSGESLCDTGLLKGPRLTGSLLSRLAADESFAGCRLVRGCSRFRRTSSDWCRLHYTCTSASSSPLSPLFPPADPLPHVGLRRNSSIRPLALPLASRSSHFHLPRPSYRFSRLAPPPQVRQPFPSPFPHSRQSWSSTQYTSTIEGVRTTFQSCDVC